MNFTIFEISLLIFLITISGGIFQWPIGYYSDKSDRRIIIIFCTFFAALFCFLSILASGTSLENMYLATSIGIDKIMFELPGPWIPGVTSDVVNRMRRELVEKYGVEVAIGNVLPEDLMFLEAFHRGLDVNAGESDRLE